MDLEQKYQDLKDSLTEMGEIAVAFSGGVDSTFLLKVAHDLLGERAIGIVATSSTYPKREFNEALELSKMMGARIVVIESEELDIEGFKSNPPDRCYFCKKELFKTVWLLTNI